MCQSSTGVVQIKSLTNITYFLPDFSFFSISIVLLLVDILVIQGQLLPSYK